MGSDDNDPWSERPDLARVFLIEHRSALERRIIDNWINSAAASRADDAPRFLLASVGSPSADDDEALRQFLGSGSDCYFVPLRVMWLAGAGEHQRGWGLRRLLLGDSRAPGRIRQHLVYRRDAGRARTLIAAGAALSELRARFADANPANPGDTRGLAQFIARQAVLALEKAERNIRGSRYKVPRLLEEEVLSRPRLLQALGEEAERSNRPLAGIMQEARDCLREMAPRHSTVAVDMMAALGRYLYTRGFDPAIDYLDADLERLRALSKQYPIAFLMTHKSHLDGFLLMCMFYDLDMPPVHLFGGINMSFLGLGALGRRSGAIFIRRTMSGDNVYKAVFKQYIDYLAEKRFPLLWALEGTRSRTGKLMPPRYGLINYVVDSYVRAASTDMILMPISIAYDQVPEVGDYIAEQKGVGKRPESASWFMQYISGLRNPFGRIHVRFGEGVKLSEVLGEPHPDLRVGALDVQKIAFRLAVDANSVTPILGTSLIALVLAAAGGKAMTLSELAEECAAMVRLVRKLRLPVSGDVNLAGMEVLQRMLGQLVHTGVLLRYEGGQEPLFAIAPDAIMAASYYRNAAIHFLVIGAIAELALVEVARRDCVNALGTLHEESLRLRDLLKFEFFFHEKAHFIEELEQHLDIREPTWRASLGEDGRALYTLLWSMHPLLAPGVLRPFVESYLVVAEALTMQAPDETPEPKTLLRFCMSLGRQRALQQRIASEESAAKVYLENGLLVAKARGLLDPATAGLALARSAHHEELDQMARRIAFVAALAENRRLGLDAGVGVEPIAR